MYDPSRDNPILGEPQKPGLFQQFGGLLGRVNTGLQAMARNPEMLAASAIGRGHNPAYVYELQARQERAKQEQEARQRALQEQEQARRSLLGIAQKMGARPAELATLANMDLGTLQKHMIGKFQPQKDQGRKTIKGADGYNYYQDTGERVLPGVVRKEDKPLVSFDTKLRTQEEEVALDTAKYLAQQARESNQTVYNRGRDAMGNLAQYNLALGLLDNIETGTLSEFKQGLGKFFKAMGADVNINDLASYEQLAPIFGDFLFQRISNTKGAISNREMELFAKLGPNYANTTEGNRRLLKFAKALSERDVQLREKVRDLRSKGMDEREIEVEVDRFIQEQDLSHLLEGENQTGDMSSIDAEIAQLEAELNAAN